jgi:hypothetical protein
LFLVRIVCVCCIGIWPTCAVAQDTASSSELQGVLSRLMTSTDKEYYEQITTAVTASASLTRRINEVAVAGKLTQIRVLPMSGITQRRNNNFSAFTDGTALVFSQELLKELRKERLHDVTYPDDVSPNNTVFVLSHLTYHLEKPVDPKAFSEPVGHMVAFVEAEARAWIIGWNAVVDAAERHNGKLLTVRQQSQLLMNFRYRGMLLRAAGIAGAPTQHLKLDLTRTGTIEASAQNLMAMQNTLMNAKVVDIE